MFCPKCGAENKDGSKFCPKCGNSLNFNYSSDSQKYYNQSPKENNKTAITIIIILIVSIFILAVVTFFIFDPFNINLFGNKTETTISENKSRKDKLNNNDEVQKNAETFEETTELNYEIVTEEMTKFPFDINEAYTKYDSYRNQSIDSEYIIPNSDKFYLTESDLDKLSPGQLRLARNEIYARHGRKFDDETLQSYFNSCSWYIGTIEPNKFNENVLNQYENKNKDFIREYELKRGYNK